MLKLLLARLFDIPVSVFVSPDGRGDGFSKSKPARYGIANNLPHGSTVRWLPGEYPALVCNGGIPDKPMLWYADSDEDGYVIVRPGDANFGIACTGGAAHIHGFTIIGDGWDSEERPEWLDRILEYGQLGNAQDD